MFVLTNSKIEKVLAIRNDNNLQLSSKKPFSSHELLEISQNISCYYAPVLRINRQNLMLLPIDPQHLFISWSLGDDYLNVNSQKKIDQDLILKIQAISKQKGGVKSANIAYEIPLSYPQSSKKLKIPNSNNTKIFTASIGNYDLNNNYIPIISSNSVTVNERKTEEKLHSQPIVKKSAISLENFNNHTENIGTTVALEDEASVEGLSKISTNSSIINHSGKGKK